MKNVVVIGGGGFIGSHVVDYLLNARHQVTVIDSVPPIQNQAIHADMDILDFSSVCSVFDGCDYVFHLAGVSNVNFAFDHPIETVNSNILGTANVLEAARKNEVKRVFLASTVWVYSACQEEFVDEESQFSFPGPGHIYSSSKISAELLMHDYYKLYGQKFTIFRYGIPYGPRMREQLVLPIFLRKAFAGEPLTIQGDGSHFRNFIYVEDLARAHVLAMDSKGENQIFNLEGLRKVTMKELAETVQDLVDKPVEIQYLPARPGDYEGKEVSRQKGKQLLNWEPEIDFEEGVKRTLDWYKDEYQL